MILLVFGRQMPVTTQRRKRFAHLFVADQNVGEVDDRHHCASGENRHCNQRTDIECAFMNPIDPHDDCQKRYPLHQCTRYRDADAAEKLDLPLNMVIEVTHFAPEIEARRECVGKTQRFMTVQMINQKSLFGLSLLETFAKPSRQGVLH